jgi:hypothetical protein
LHKTANIVPLEIKSATDSVCLSTMLSRSVSWSLSGPGDIRSYSFIRITNLCQIETRFDTISRNTHLTITKINFLSIPALNPVSRFDESPGFL